MKFHNNRVLHVIVTHIVSVSLLFLTACTSDDNLLYSFINDNCNGEYNAIHCYAGDDCELFYYIDYGYGVCISNAGRAIIKLDYVSPLYEKNEFLFVYEATPESLSRALNEGNELVDGTRGTLKFWGPGVFSDGNTVFTFLDDHEIPGGIVETEGQPLTFRKISINSKDIVPLELLIEELNLLSDDYNSFLEVTDGQKFVCEEAGFWVDAVTKEGEWNANGAIVPIKMVLSDKAPYVEIYDLSDGRQKRILTSYGRMIDCDTLLLTENHGDMLYKNEIEISIVKIADSLVH